MKTMSTSKKELKALRMAAANLIQETLRPDQIAISKNGTLTCRWTYCYWNGRDDPDYAGKVMDLLTLHKIDHDVTDHGNMWNEYHRNATVSQQPHFYVEVKVAA